MQSAPEKSYQWMFGTPKLSSQPPTPGNQRYFASKKVIFTMSWTQGQRVNEGKGAAVGRMPHLEGL